MTSQMLSRVEDEKVLVLERVFDAPRELVYRMFSEAEHLRHWWGPRGWEVTHCVVDFRPGGAWHYCFKCMDRNQGDFYGMESWGKGLYHDIESPERIVYDDYFSDAEGNLNTEMPATACTLLFEEEEDGKTRLINRAEYATADNLKMVMDMGMLQGITETWDRLEERLAELRK
ncbi:SRPBCC domain-containing protein [Paenibacillus chartarius]|uniref:SRPBCC domain-containing protein n=1 Tax=Paenibacillus chartarius TaxID=747481 RepID=A0ABV6DEF9_9BACL